MLSWLLADVWHGSICRGYKARTPYTFILPAYLFPYADSMATIFRAHELVFASAANASPYWSRVQILFQNILHIPCVALQSSRASTLLQIEIL